MNAIQSLRFDTPNGMIGVDSENNIIKGYVLASTGTFKTGRGEFDGKSLRAAYKLMKAEPDGLRVRFGHPNPLSDGIGKFLGRARNPVIETTPTGEHLRGDMHLDPTAMTLAPLGSTPLGKYVMELAKSDSKAFGTSLQLRSDMEYRLDAKGRPKTDESGKPLPPLWRPTQLLASDVVDEGDATQSFLGADQFETMTADEIRRWFDERRDNFLAYKFGDDQAEREARERLVRLWELENDAA